MSADDLKAMAADAMEGELRRQIADLQGTVRMLRMKLSYHEARCMCPDCRDKVPAGMCPRCHGQQSYRAPTPSRPEKE